MRAFEKAMDRCVKANVEFIIVSGDLFDGNIPELQTVKRAAEVIREVKDQGIRIYVTYGSHDYSASATSMIDVLHSAGLFQKVVEAESITSGSEERLRLKFIKDQIIGVKLVGIYGRRNGLEKDYFEIIDRDYLQEEAGFKIFVFHSAITELRPENFAYGETIPLSLLPKGFPYYAGGHIHKRLIQYVDGYGHIAYPGPTFGATFTDLEDTALGEKRGFYIVDFDKEVTNISFEQIEVCSIVYRNFDADKKTSRQVSESLKQFASEVDCKGKVVLIKVKGQLSSGKLSDIPFDQIRRSLLDAGALVARINHSSLTSEEIASLKVMGETKQEIESRLIEERISGYKIDPSITDPKVMKIVSDRLLGKGGISTAQRLLTALKVEQKENESKDTFRNRVLRDAQDELRLGEP
jgi:DNA repair exonuclease SbcCD nuclease subunit